MADKPKSPFTDQERYLLGVQQKIDRAEIHPDGPEGQWLRERARLAGANPDGPEARQIREEAHLGQRYGDAQQDQTKEVAKDVTPEQKASVDKALGKVEISAQIGGATDVSSSPRPNEPTPMDKARDLAGVY